MTSSKLTKMYNINWDEIINECDYNGDGVIDFQEFISACIDRKVLSNQNDLRVAFRILDTNKDNTISIEDFDDLFNAIQEITGEFAVAGFFESFSDNYYE